VPLKGCPASPDEVAFNEEKLVKRLLLRLLLLLPVESVLAIAAMLLLLVEAPSSEISI
jgi:hypothetical protein